MPKRTNLFQEVVTIIHEHMAEGATVEESAMLTNRVSGDPREVDVAIRSHVAGHEVIVSVEATATGRRADAPWVERMIGKHADLPTAQLVLVSEAGFTRPARVLAEGKGVLAISPEDLAVEDPAYKIVNALPALWPKVVSLTPQKAQAFVEKPDGEKMQVRDLPPDVNLYLEDGSYVGTLLEAFEASFRANFERVAEMIGLADITENRDEFFTLSIGPQWRINVDDQEKDLFLRWEKSDEPELHRIEVVEFVGRSVITVGEIPLRHRRLGEVAFSYGEGRIGDQPALLVVSENESGGALTLRVRPQPPKDGTSG